MKAVREGSEKANLELARAEVELERAKLEIERLKKELVETTTTSQKIKTEEKPQTTQKTNCLVKEFVGKRLTRARKPAAEVAEHQSTEKGRKSPIKNPREENQCNKTTNPGPILARTGKRNYSLVETPLDGGNVPEEDEEDELDDEEVEEEEDDDEEDNRMLARRVTRSARVAEDKDDSLKGILNKPKPKNRKLISL